MFENIFAGILIVMAIAGGIWAWWLESASAKQSDKDMKEKGDEKISNRG